MTFCKGRGALTKRQNISYRRRAEQTGAIQVYHKLGSGGNFCDISEKIAILTLIGSHFARFQSHLKKLNCYKVKELNCSTPFTSWSSPKHA